MTTPMSDERLDEIATDVAKLLVDEIRSPRSQLSNNEPCGNCIKLSMEKDGMKEELDRLRVVVGEMPSAETLTKFSLYWQKEGLVSFATLKELDSVVEWIRKLAKEE